VVNRCRTPRAGGAERWRRAGPMRWRGAAARGSG
jgi:hypothetical protein